MILFGLFLLIGILYLYNTPKKQDEHMNTTSNKKQKTQPEEKVAKQNADSSSSLNRSIAQQNIDQDQTQQPSYNVNDPVLEKLIEKYKAKDEIKHKGVDYLVSEYSAIDKKDYDPSMGEKIDELYGRYIIFNNTQGAQQITTSALVINTLTFQPGIVTGKMLVQVTNDNRDVLTNLSQEENFKIGFLRPYVDIQEIEVKPALRTFALNSIFEKNNFSLIEIEIVSGKHYTR